MISFIIIAVKIVGAIVYCKLICFPINSKSRIINTICAWSNRRSPTGVKVTRIASGVPVGGDLECIDEMTLLRALEGRTEL